jgi:eukaryotic-like serine/threonine-protein kinase
MVEKGCLIAPRDTTPAPTGTPQTRFSRRLPQDLVNDQLGRLSLFSLIGMVLWTVSLLLDQLVILTNPVVFEIAGGKTRVIEVVGIVVSGAMFAYVRYSRHTPEMKTNISLTYLLLNAAAIAALNTWVAQPPMQGHVVGVSWIAILLLIYSMVAAVSPGKMLAAALVAASFDPIGVWLAHLRGVPTPSFLVTLLIFWPNYASAGLATVPPRFLRHVGRKLNKARELGSYELVTLLGQGGMGEVWEAKHRLLARRAAVKLVRPELLGASNDDEARLVLKRFEREAQATAALSSPHTIQVFDFGSTNDGTFYYVMELLSGRDLDSLVRQFGPLPADRALHLLAQVCHSLAEAHARGLVHRDIKPANIYACRMGLEYDFVKVLDFGLVKFKDSSSVRQTLMTAEHGTTGTPAFMAPEIILGDGDVDRRADVYALGCVMHYLLTGQLVFEADTPMRMLMHHVQTPPVPPSQRTELPIPRELDDLVMACLEKDPEKRPQDAEQLLTMVRRCQDDDSWDGDQAKQWWESHLLELTGPLLVTESVSDAALGAVVIH